MAALIISISSDTSEESVRSSTSRVVLFGTIPTIIPADVSTLEPASIPSTHQRISITPDPVHRVQPATPLSLHSCYSFKDIRDCYSGSLKDHYIVPSHEAYVVSGESVRFTSRLGDSFISRPYHPLLIGVLRMMDGKEVGTSVLGSYIAEPIRWFHSSSSSHLARGDEIILSPTTLVTSATPILGALLHVHDNLLPPRKRIRGSLVALSLKDTIEESLDVDSEEDIDLDVMADIEADICSVEALVQQRDEIRVDRVFKPEIPAGSLVPASGRGSREDFEIRGLGRSKHWLMREEMAHMRERISVTRGSKSDGDLGKHWLRRESGPDSVWRPIKEVLSDELRPICSTMIIPHSGMTYEAIEEMITRRVAEALAKQEANRRGNDGNGNGGKIENNGDHGDNKGGAKIVARECTYMEFLNCQLFKFKGTEGAVTLERVFKKDGMLVFQT
ncbi:hypothetical protein Tco_0337271 [Tanacetum coccineum]